jgi:phosphate-selective porin
MVLKYDIYDPNTSVKGNEVGSAGSNTHAGDVRFNTFGLGYNYMFNPHIKLLLWYDMVYNEKTSLDGFTEDVKDNVFTCRVQFRF